jgi:hypothetical protein
VKGQPVRSHLVAGILVLSALAAAGSGAPTPAGASTSKHPASSTTTPRPLVGPHTTPTEDTSYLADVAKADPALGTYVQQRGNVALRALLTDGSAFCAFLRRGGGIDRAILSVAVGAKSVEATTHLPSKIVTYNTMEAVALITLCPSEQKLVPPAVRTRLRTLGKQLAQ